MLVDEKTFFLAPLLVLVVCTFSVTVPDSKRGNICLGPGILVGLPLLPMDDLSGKRGLIYKWTKYKRIKE